MFVLFRTVFLAAAVLLLCAGASPAQDQGIVAPAQDRMIVWSDHPRGSRGELSAAPVQLLKQIDWLEIQSIEVEGTSVIIGQPFKASSDWIKNITLRVKNNSTRAITYVQFVLTLPQTKREPQAPYTIDAQGVKQGVRIQPGETAELRLLDGGGALYKWLKSVAAEQKVDFSTIDKAEVLYVLVFLDDGTQWSSGC